MGGLRADLRLLVRVRVTKRRAAMTHCAFRANPTKKASAQGEAPASHLVEVKVRVAKSPPFASERLPTATCFGSTRTTTSRPRRSWAPRRSRPPRAATSPASSRASLDAPPPPPPALCVGDGLFAGTTTTRNGRARPTSASLGARARREHVRPTCERVARRRTARVRERRRGGGSACAPRRSASQATGPRGLPAAARASEDTPRAGLLRPLRGIGTASAVARRSMLPTTFTPLGAHLASRTRAAGDTPPFNVERRAPASWDSFAAAAAAGAASREEEGTPAAAAGAGELRDSASASWLLADRVGRPPAATSRARRADVVFAHGARPRQLGGDPRAESRAAFACRVLLRASRSARPQTHYRSPPLQRRASALRALRRGLRARDLARARSKSSMAAASATARAP